jgi:hypothetical protein
VCVCAVGEPKINPLPPPVATKAHGAFARLPLSFEENRGQTDAHVKFLSRGSGYSLFITSTSAVLKLRQPSAPRRAGNRAAFSSIRIGLKDPNLAPQLDGVGELAGKSNYFIGRDPTRWRTGIPTFAGVRLANVYPGINLLYRGEQGRLEYDLELAPHADASRIKLEVDGARDLSLDAAHNLVIRTAAGDVIQHAPVIYQTIDGQMHPVSGGYVLKDAHTVEFALGKYDTSRALVIDPLLTYASYLGGTGGDEGVSIAVDQNDSSAWITGTTSSTDFPVTSDAFQSTNFGDEDVFVTKVSPDGSTLEYSTYAGGSNNDEATGIAVDPNGNAYVTGLTLSPDFPVSDGAYQITLKGTQDAFALALDPNGGLIYSTFLGTAAAGVGIAVDPAGEAIVAGTTYSANFPTTSGSFQSIYPGNNSNPEVGFVTKLNFEGTGPIFSTFMGLSDGGWPFAVALDPSNNIYLAGGTSTGVEYNAQTCAPDVCGFIVELDSGGATVDFSDVVPFAALLGIATDSAGDAHVIGTRGGPVLINLDSAGNPTLMMLSLGGDPSRIAIGQTSGNIFLSGVTDSTSLAVTPGAYQSTYGGAGDAFVSVLDPTGFFNLYTTYLGGSGLDLAQGVAVDTAENAYVTGTTQSTDFPVTAGVFEGQHPDSGNGLAFVARIVPVLQSPTATMTASATPVTTPISTIMNPPTPTAIRTPLPTHSTNATPVPTLISSTTPTAIQSVQGGGTPMPTVTVTATATATSTATPTPTATPIGAVRVAPPGLIFPKIKVGRESGLRVAVFANPRTNKGTAMIAGIELQSQLTSSPPTGFEIDAARTTCHVGSAIAPAHECRIFVRFVPLKTGAAIDTLFITGNFTNSGALFALTGAGR